MFFIGKERMIEKMFPTDAVIWVAELKEMRDGVERERERSVECTAGA